MDPENTGSRRRALFVSYLYPSSNGSGTQIRAASLIRMLAACGEVTLLVINRHKNIPGPPDAEMESLCREIRYLRILPEPEERDRWQDNAADTALADVAVIDCESGGIAGALKRFYDEHGLDFLFVFRIESYFLMEGAWALFPHRGIDLDELAFRRSRLIESLKLKNSGLAATPADKRARAVARILEEKVISHFEKVFVSSEIEAGEVRSIAEERKIHVLPNIVPSRVSCPAPPATDPQEILFVGTLSYYPNEDAVRFFCREIFPLIRRAKGESVLFRIIGFGCPHSLEEVGKLPGVQLMGYQENLEPFYAQATLVVVPLRAGTGTRLKILEAFALYRPVVSTSIGAEGLKVVDGENILLRDDPRSYADACLGLLDRPDWASHLVQGGSILQREAYSLENLVKSYRAALG